METLVLIAVVLFVVLPIIAGVVLRMLAWALFGYLGAKVLQRFRARRVRSVGDDR